MGTKGGLGPSQVPSNICFLFPAKATKTGELWRTACSLLLSCFQLPCAVSQNSWNVCECMPAIFLSTNVDTVIIQLDLFFEKRRSYYHWLTSTSIQRYICMPQSPMNGLSLVIQCRGQFYILNSSWIHKKALNSLKCHIFFYYTSNMMGSSGPYPITKLSLLFLVFWELRKTVLFFL